ncbi:hypothetical protein BHM03_00056329 [Ensete ventricosum]|nr:hypothetical protein BHM03_00056329 [Ensete ventricosum]
MIRVSIDFSCTVSKIQNVGHSGLINPLEVVRARFYEKIVEFRSVFLAPFQNFKILAIPDVFAHESSFDRFSCTVSEIQNTGHSRLISP